MTELGSDSAPVPGLYEQAPIEDDELDRLADKLGSYTLARIQLGLEAPFPGTSELPRDTNRTKRSRRRKPSGHVRFTEPGAADNNLAMGYGMTKRPTQEQADTNARGLALARAELAKSKQNMNTVTAHDQTDIE